MIKCNLLIDGNYLLMRVVHILHKNKILTSELYNVIEKDYLNLTKIYSFDKIYFISDSSKNWRRNFFEGYKSTRKKDTNIDWNFVYNEFFKLKDYLNSKLNCIKYQIDELEGDDLISYIVKKLNDKKESTFIVSSDSDLLQLINYDIDKRYINIMYNFKMTDDTVYLPKFYEFFFKEIKNSYVDDIFEDSNEIDFLNFINDFISIRKKILINSEEELFMKIMGHNKDNIKSIFMKGDKGIGKSGIEKIYKTYKETHPEPIDFNSNIFKKRLIDHVKLYKKLRDNMMDDEMLEKLNRNLTLVKLDKESMPKHLYEKMEKEIKIG